MGSPLVASKVQNLVATCIRSAMDVSGVNMREHVASRHQVVPSSLAKQEREEAAMATYSPSGGLRPPQLFGKTPKTSCPTLPFVPKISSLRPMLDALDQLSRLAHGSKFRRLRHRPLRYLQGQFYQHVIYPRTRKGKLVQVETFFGATMLVVLPAGMDLYLIGGKSHDSEIRLARLMTKRLAAGDTVVDIGAHFGYFSLLAAQLVGESGRVISIEASEAMHSVLDHNAKAYPQIHTHHLACSDREATLTFYEFPVLYSEYNTLFPQQFEGAKWLTNNPPKAVEVAGQPLDKLLSKPKVTPTFIKIDVEGAEQQVINGMTDLLRRGERVLIAMEFLQAQRGNQPHVAAATQLIAAGYQAHLIDAQGDLQPTTLSDIDDQLLALELDSDNVVFTPSADPA
jgi:FkbM family methyltransferase